MKHNLPTPSQAWGTDIDRRLASLESLVRTHDNKLTNSSDTLSALVQSNAANGIAQPFSFTGFKSKLVFTQNNSFPLYNQYLDWGNSGSFMIVSVSGFITIKAKDNIALSSGLFQADISVHGGGLYGTSILVPGYGQTLSASLAFTTLINYNDVSDPYVNITLHGYNPDQYLVSGSDASSLRVSVSGVRY